MGAIIDVILDGYREAHRLTKTKSEHVRRLSNITIRLYYKGRVVHKQDVTLNVRKKGWRCTIFGTSENVLMEGFTGRADEITVALFGVPHETDVTPLGESLWPVNILKGNTLTLQTRPQGLLRLES